MSDVAVARLDEIEVGQPHLVQAEGKRIVLTRVGDAVYALDEMCAHQGGPLSDGRLSGTRLTCPWHGWSYDVRTGQCLLPARGGSVPSYPVRLEAGQVWVTLP